MAVENFDDFDKLLPIHQIFTHQFIISQKACICQFSPIKYIWKSNSSKFSTAKKITLYSIAILYRTVVTNLVHMYLLSNINNHSIAMDTASSRGCCLCCNKVLYKHVKKFQTYKLFGWSLLWTTTGGWYINMYVHTYVHTFIHA